LVWVNPPNRDHYNFVARVAQSSSLRAFKVFNLACRSCVAEKDLVERAVPCALLIKRGCAATFNIERRSARSTFDFALRKSCD
jgi:hypothetical protein